MIPRRLQLPKVPAPALRVILLLTLLIVIGSRSCSKLQGIRNGYKDVLSVEAGKEDASEKATSSGIMKQGEVFQSWSVLILAGIIAISVSTKIHRTPAVSWIYLLLGPAATFLVFSLNTGWVLTKRHTYLAAKNNFSNLDDLISLLALQWDLFFYAVVCVSLFASWFLFLIVLGKIEPFEQPRGA
jgi:hypothetical protein